jgi:acyl carrier protein
MSSAGVAELVRSFLLKKLPSAKKKSFNDDAPLLEAGIIDSLGVLDLVGFLERSFAIRITDDELTPETFASVKSIVSFVKQKKEKIEVSAAD